MRRGAQSAHEAGLRARNVGSLAGDVGGTRETALRHVGTARQPELHDDAGFAGLGIGGAQFHNVLAAIGAVEEQLLAVGGPLDGIDVMANDRIIERFALAEIDADGFL